MKAVLHSYNKARKASYLDRGPLVCSNSKSRSLYKFLFYSNIAIFILLQKFNKFTLNRLKNIEVLLHDDTNVNV